MNTRSSNKKKKEDEKKSPSMKRTGTMATTAEEGKELLKEEGFKESNKNERETRSGKRTRDNVEDVVETMFNADAKKTTEMTQEELEKYKESLIMVFRIFDQSKKGYLGRTELEAALRSLGKKSTKSKIDSIFNSMDKQKNGKITSDEFVEFMINKKKFKSTKEKESQNNSSSSNSPSKKKKATKVSPKKKEKSTKEEEKEVVKEDKQEISNTNPPSNSNSNQSNSNTNQNEMSRGLSITNFFTPFAGLHDEIKTGSKDAHLNPLGRNFDLGHEGSFSMFNVILFHFLGNSYWHAAVDALKSKGFTVYLAKDENDFLDNLPYYDEAWIASGSAHTDPTKLVPAIRKYHESGKGLFIWADNDPYYYEANVILKDLLGIQLKGNDYGNKVLKVGDGKKTGEFARHLITTGLVTLHEGITICYPDKLTEKTQVLATNSDGHPCIIYCDPSAKFGPIVIDTGFTKLYPNFWVTTAGNDRYVRNAAVWLLSLDYRIKIGAPWRGAIEI